MTLDPISIATAGYVCGGNPNSLSIATRGYICTAVQVIEEFFFGAADDGRRLEEDRLILAVIKAFMARI